MIKKAYFFLNLICALSNSNAIDQPSRYSFIILSFIESLKVQITAHREDISIERKVTGNCDPTKNIDPFYFNDNDKVERLKKYVINVV